MTTDPPTLPESLLAIAPLLASLGQPPDNPVAAMGAHRQLVARSTHDVWDDLPGITALLYRVTDGGHAFMFQDPAAWPAIVEFIDHR